MNSSVTKSLAVLVATCLSAASVSAQTPGSHPMNTATATDVSAQDTAGLQQEVARLREQVQALEQRLQQTEPSTPARSWAMKMNMHGGPSKQMSTGPQSAMSKGNMSMMEDDLPMSSPAAGASMPAAAGGRTGMKMMEMGMQDDDMMGMGAMAIPSALPGFPGQSHLYHIGAGGFFLDHPEHISLTSTQQQALARLKEQTLLRQGELQRQIDAAEEKLWQLTGSDQPQIASIDKQVKEIERLRAEKRIAFIRAIGDAGKTLTDEQRMQLTGLAPAASTDSNSMPDGNQSPSGHR